MEIGKSVRGLVWNSINYSVCSECSRDIELEVSPKPWVLASSSLINLITWR